MWTTQNRRRYDRSALRYPSDRWDYFYLPSSQIIFTPLSALGHRAGGALWELIAVSLLSLAAWQWSRILF